MDTHIPYLREIILFLVAAGLVVPLVRKVGISPVLGFLFAGLVIGPYGLRQLLGDAPGIEYLVISDVEGVRRVAELGVVFLLFTIGLELSVAQLWAMRRLVFGLGTAQVMFSALIIGAIAYGFGNPLVAAVILGLCLALSSTALVMQLMTESGRLSVPAGRAAFGVLLLQDLAVVPILFFVGVAGATIEGSLAATAALTLLEAAAIIAAIFLVGRIIVRPLLRFVSATGSREAFMAIIVLLVLATSVITAQAGLSMALGAFLAGLLFAGTEYRHQIASDIEPFKGLLLGLFFISVGMSLDILAVWSDIGLVLLSVAGLVAIKSAVLFGFGLAFRLPRHVAAETALMMSQGGEFAFVVIAAALGFGLLDPDIAQFMLLVVIVTMFLTPALSAGARWLGKTLQSGNAENDFTAAASSDQHPVIIGGFGRVGRMLAQLLDEQRVPYVAVDTDPEIAERGRAEGLSVFFGDASRQDVLEHLGIERAAAFATTMDQPGSAGHIIRSVHQTWPHVPIFARARDPQDAHQLKTAGALAAVPETVEASLELCEEVLIGLGFPEDAAQSIVDQRRRPLENSAA